MADCIELGNNQTILFTGDSITAAGRRNVGPLGEGYVSVVAKVLTAKYPQLNLKMINTGISGDTTRSLKFRWNKDCLLHRPDILSLMIGINDLWYCHAEPELHIKGVPTDEYEDNCRYMLENAQTQCDCQIIIAEPFMFCSDPQNPMFADLRNYIAIVHRLAAEFDAVLVPLQKLIDAEIAKIPPEKWADDMVHPHPWAHEWIAQKWLKAAQL